jgi:hypothetical protein
LGFKTRRAAAAIAPLVDRVDRRIADASAHAVTAVLRTERTTADAPVRYKASIWTGSRFNRCGSGSQTAPICCQPGVRLSMTRRATTRCARAS